MSNRNFRLGEIWSIYDYKVLFPTRNPETVDPTKPRLVMILQNDVDNAKPLFETVTVAPITTSWGVTSQCFVLETADSGLNERSLLKLAFIQPLIKNHIHEKKAEVTPEVLVRIKAMLAANLGLINKAPK